MKVLLERDGASFELQRLGRQIFVTEDGASRTLGFFDDDEADAAAARLLDERRAAGWAPSAATLQAEQERERAQRAAQALQQRVQAAASDDDPRRAARALLAPALGQAPRFEELIARVVAVQAPAANGARLTLTSRASIQVALASSASQQQPWLAAVLDDIETLWLYLDDAGRDDHNLCFGRDVGPPEPGDLLEGTPWQDKDVAWFLEESPWDRFFFFCDGVARSCAFDGGVSDAPHDGPLAALLVERILTLLDDA